MRIKLALVSTRGFTLIELIVVIAIIAILAAIIAPNAFKAIEKAKIARVVTEVKTIKTAALSYYGDIQRWPPDYRLITLLNPFLENPDPANISNWDGPYVERWNVHPWAGAIGWLSSYDADASGVADCTVALDDDRPGTDSNDNGGLIPFETMKKIDAALDDGNLTKGKARGRAPDDTTPVGPETFGTANGEMSIVVINDGSLL